MTMPSENKKSRWKGWVIASSEDEHALEVKRKIFAMGGSSSGNQTVSPSPSQQLVGATTQPTNPFTSNYIGKRSSPRKSPNSSPDSSHVILNAPNGNAESPKLTTELIKSSLKSTDGTPHRKKAAITIKNGDERDWRRNPTRITASQTFDSERDIADEVLAQLTKISTTSSRRQRKAAEEKIKKRLFNLTQDLPDQSTSRPGLPRVPCASFSNAEGTLLAVFVPKEVEDYATSKYGNLNDAKLTVPVFMKRFSYLEADFSVSSDDIVGEEQEHEVVVDGADGLDGDDEEPAQKKIKV